MLEENFSSYMRFFSPLILLSFTISTPVFAEPLTIMGTEDGITWDTQNDRYVGGCWEGKGNETFEYTLGDQKYLEVCNEPDETAFGKGGTVEERAKNYYDFLKKTVTAERGENPNIKIVLGSLSGFNYPFLKAFLSEPNACDLFDVFAFHPYHLGVAPDEINTEKNAWHTAEQWVNFYKTMLHNAECEKPIWTTEFGYTTIKTNAEHAITESEQTDFAIKQTVLMLGAGVERTQYYNAEGFVLSVNGQKEYETLLQKLNGTTFKSLEFFGEPSCPRGEKAGCWYTNDQYKTDTGITDYGLPVKNTEVKKGRKYTFTEGNRNVVISWTSGELGYSLEEFTLVFSDLFPSDKAFEAAGELKTLGVINGYTDGTFQPSRPVSRAELLKMVFVASHTPLVEGTEECFSDISSEDWFFPYVCTAAEKKIIKGYEDGTFKPNNPVSFAEAIKIIVNALGILVTDKDGEWWQKFVEAGETAEILKKDEITTENAGSSATRGDIAVFLWRGIQREFNTAQ